jgi:uncharacterized protein DUF6894
MMPTYFFDVVNGHRLADPAGLDCADQEHAKIQAQEIARQIAQEVPTSVQHRRVSVVDQQGREVASIDITEAG